MTSTSDNEVATTGHAIHARGLTKHFLVPVREPGLRSALRSVVRREHRTVRAVDDVDITIAHGEIVGFLGPNGAGKTTTLKMLAGLLHPSHGEATVLGYEPYRRDRSFLRRISLVMGQRHQLNWDIPAADSFEMLRSIYNLNTAAYDSQRAKLVDLLDLSGILDKPVRQLSLGERMKCELAAALLHEPEVLFLDEPTLGLDVTAQRRVREFISEYARSSGATVLLTSHYMADIEALAERVLVIHHGSLQFDGALADLTRTMSNHKLITVRTDPNAGHDKIDAVTNLLKSRSDSVASDGNELVVELPRDAVRSALRDLLTHDVVLDFTVEDEPIEHVIDRVFSTGTTS